jgi:hypothetical protein
MTPLPRAGEEIGVSVDRENSSEARAALSDGVPQVDLFEVDALTA